MLRSTSSQTGGRRLQQTSYNRICRCNGRDDVLNHALSERPGDALNLELFGPSRCNAVQPADVLWVIRVKLEVYKIARIQLHSCKKWEIKLTALDFGPL